MKTQKVETKEVKNFLLKKPITITIDDAASAYVAWNFFNSSSEFHYTGNRREDVEAAKDLIMKPHPSGRERPADVIWRQINIQLGENEISPYCELRKPGPSPILVALNEEHSAIVEPEGVKVGCQTFSFDKIEELYKAVQKFKLESE
jgi:hypothetical protein